MAKPTPLEIKETSLSSQIAEYLSARQIYNDRLQCGKIKTERGNWMTLCKYGTPDRFCIVRGIIIFIEVKRNGKKPSAEQTDRHNELKEAGAIVIVADSFDNFIQQFAAVREEIEARNKGANLYD